MRLSELEPRFVQYAARSDARYIITVDTLAAAHGILFLCPICWKANGNSAVGTHAIDVTFAGRGVPDDQGSHGDDGKPTRWTVTGTGFEDLSTQPSILLTGGCAWHGFITNGDVS